MIIDIEIDAGFGLFAIPESDQVWHFSPAGTPDTACGVVVDWGPDKPREEYGQRLSPGSEVCAECLVALVAQEISE
jgi:hypothetical protein